MPCAGLSRGPTIRSTPEFPVASDTAGQPSLMLWFSSSREAKVQERPDGSTRPLKPTVASTDGAYRGSVPALPNRAPGDLCLHPRRAVLISGADQPEVGATPPLSPLCRIGLKPLSGYACQRGQLHALRQQGLIYALPRFMAPWIHLNSLLISAAAFPLGADSHADNPEVKAWTCSIL